MPIVRTVLLLIVVSVIALVAGGAYFDTKLHRVDALVDYAGRPADTPGTNWLIVGSDSRQGMTAAQQKEYSTGGDLGNGRTDTIMLVHIPRSGKPLLISIPRDLYVPIPGQGDYKINAAYYFGGPQLLEKTFETKSGVHIDHYAEIGFGGFADMVDAVGGIRMCLDAPLNDPEAGIRLKAGCQTMNGRTALGYVRSRHFPAADLERVVHQREFLAALMHKVTSPSTLIDPFALWGVTKGAVDGLTVDNGTHIWDIIRLAWALKSSPITVTTPTDGNEDTDDGEALVWGASTDRFFALIRAGRPVPSDLLTSGPG
ncbi:hypothetical protein GCM10023147_46480 [Tsukamurella soli]|uniref:Cell envelope-related transcriptional attenuator domain-containing protein n=1 Tax=Tsukamurella soli TaxID=644556 RepID=A0ABP8KE42_9ACTN